MLMTDPRWESARHGGRIDGRWLQTVELPTARAFSRGYDRITVDGLLDDCAETIDELTFHLRDACDEVAVLRRQARTRAGRRAGSRIRGRRSAHGHRRRRVRLG